MKPTVLLLVSLTLFTVPSFSQDTVHVITGWNIIGSLDAGAVSDVLVSVPPGIVTTSFFGYAPGTGYRALDTLEKGMGYWIKVSQDGIVIFGDTVPSVPCGTRTIDHLGGLYHTVEIGGRCWLKENINAGTFRPWAAGVGDNGIIEKHCWADEVLNCEIYGGWYQWDEAMEYVAADGARGICPPGWHIPTNGELQSLSSAVGGDANALKAVGQGTGAGAGTNTSEWSALFAPTKNAEFWSSTSVTDDDSYSMYLKPDDAFTYLDVLVTQANRFSIRCIED